MTHINKMISMFTPISTSDSCACLRVPKWLSGTAALTIHQRPPVHKCSWGIACVTASLSPPTSSSCLLSYLSLEVAIFSRSGELDSFRCFGWVRWWSTFHLSGLRHTTVFRWFVCTANDTIFFPRDREREREAGHGGEGWILFICVYEHKLLRITLQWTWGALIYGRYWIGGLYPAENC